MIFIERSVAAVLLSCLVVFSLSAQPDRDKSQTLFTIHSRPVSTEEFIYLYRKNHQGKEDFTKDKIEAYLDLFIKYKLKVQEALSRGMDTTTVFKKEYQTYRDELLKPYLPDARVIDSLVLLTYERLKEEVNASHILVMVKPDASPADTLEAYRKISLLRTRAVAGEDFGALAAEFSEEPQAEVSRGNLGYFTAMQMVFPFEQAAYLTPVGGVSRPVRTQFGYHIIKVHDRRPSRGEVEVSHIMIRTGDDPTNESAKNRIFDIHDQLQKGVKWEELCEQHSEDPNSKGQGGRLRPFGVGGMASVPQFQEMAFSLQEQGQISDPFLTQFGWHILRLESKIPLPSFEEIKPSLAQRVSRDERVQISKDALRKRMRTEFGYTENLEVKSQLMDSAVSILSSKNPKVSIPHMQEEVLFTMKNKPYRVKDFLTYLEDQPPATPISSRQNAEHLFLQYVDAVQLQLLEEKVKSESPEYKWLLKEYYEGILLFEIMEKEVWNKAMEDTVGQRNYFLAHAARYKAGERMVGELYSSQSKEHLQQLKDLVGQDSAAHSFIATRRIRRESGILGKEDRPVFSKITWAPGLHMAENNGMYYLVGIEKILPPGPQTFEEARASVISDYQTFLEESWITELKRKFVVKVEKKAKKRAFEELMPD